MNGTPAVILRVNDKAILVLSIEVDRGQVREIQGIGNPDKLKGSSLQGVVSLSASQSIDALV